MAGSDIQDTEDAQIFHPHWSDRNFDTTNPNIARVV